MVLVINFMALDIIYMATHYHMSRLVQSHNYTICIYIYHWTMLLQRILGLHTCSKIYKCISVHPPPPLRHAIITIIASCMYRLCNFFSAVGCFKPSQHLAASKIRFLDDMGKENGEGVVNSLRRQRSIKVMVDNIDGRVIANHLHIQCYSNLSFNLFTGLCMCRSMSVVCFLLIKQRKTLHADKKVNI